MLGNRDLERLAGRSARQLLRTTRPRTSKLTERQQLRQFDADVAEGGTKIKELVESGRVEDLTDWLVAMRRIRKKLGKGS